MNILKCYQQGSGLSSSLTATISFFTVPPEFVIPLSEMTCETGETVILKCKVCGRPKASITWKGPDHNILSNDSHYSISCRYWASLHRDLYHIGRRLQVWGSVSKCNGFDFACPHPSSFSIVPLHLEAPTSHNSTCLVYLLNYYSLFK